MEDNREALHVTIVDDQTGVSRSIHLLDLTDQEFREWVYNTIFNKRDRMEIIDAIDKGFSTYPRNIRQEQDNEPVVLDEQTKSKAQSIPVGNKFQKIQGIKRGAR